MPRYVISATHQTPSPAMPYLLAYLEEGRVRVFAARRRSLWVAQQLPVAEERRLEARLRELHRSGRRTEVVEIELHSDKETNDSVSVLCVRA